jgi:SulP family sulfate permease
VAVLSAIESLLSAAVADGMTGSKHDPDSELVGLGIGNILSGFASGIPAAGAVARTVMNVHSGAKTPLSSVLHSLFILLYILLLAPYMSSIPMASLAALLITVAYRMSHWRQFVRVIEIAPKSDTLVLISCFGFTVFIDMVAGIFIGVVLACLLLVKRLSNLTQYEIESSSADKDRETPHLELPRDIMVYHINGPLFFGAIERVIDRTDFIQDNVRTLIIDMEKVSLLDMTGMVAMKAMILDIQKKNLVIFLCGNKKITAKILRKLSTSIDHNVKVVETVKQALKLAAPEEVLV